MTDSDNILSGKCQMLQILRAIVLAILEKALFDPSDQTIGSNIQSDRIRLRRLPIGFRHQESNRILSDYRIPYDPTLEPIGSDIGFIDLGFGTEEFLIKSINKISQLLLEAYFFVIYAKCHTKVDSSDVS